VLVRILRRYKGKDYGGKGSHRTSKVVPITSARVLWQVLVPRFGGYDLNRAPPNHLLLSAWDRYRYNMSWISKFVLYLVNGKR
jgi:hypothetical protein